MHIDPSKDLPERRSEPFRARGSTTDADMVENRGRRKKKKVRRRPKSEEETWGDGAATDRTRILSSRRLRVLVILVVGLGAVGAVLGIRADRGRKDAAASYDMPEREDFLGSVFPNIPALVPEDGVALTKRLLAAENEAAVEELIRPGKMTVSEAMEFLNDLPHAAEIHWVGSLHSHEVPAMALIVVPVRGPFRVVFFRPAPDDTWKIDFDAFARHSDSPIGEFMDGTRSRGTYRLVAAGDHYYNGPYGDDEEWRCVALKSPDHGETLYGYCRRGSEQDKALAKLGEFAAIRGNEKGNEVTPGDAVSYRTTLSLRREPGGDARQVEIVSVVAEDWLVSEVNYDQR